MNIYEIRDQYPILNRKIDGKPLVYLDNAATSQTPRCVVETINDMYFNHKSNVHRGVHTISQEATNIMEATREKVRQFINAKSTSEIVFTRGTTEAINLVASSYGDSLFTGDEIVLTVMEHHSNIIPWQQAAKRAGARLVWLEPDAEGRFSDEELSKIGPKTRLVAVTMVSNVLGVTNPIKEIAERAHAVGAVIAVDGAQSTPHQHVDVTALDADFYVFSGHKMLAPFGIGALYGKKALLEAMPPFLTGGEMIEFVTREDATWAPLPAKFEAGTVNAGDAVGLGAAIDYLESVGFDAIEEHENRLAALAMEGMRKMPHVTLYGPTDPARHSGIVTFNIEGCHPHDVASVLDSENICIRAGHHCAQPLMKFLGVGSTARASLYFYNTEDEVARFLEALGHVRGWLGY